MNALCFLLGDSRVRALNRENVNIIKSWSIPGAKLYDLYEVVEGELSTALEEADEPPIVYVMAGICDLTYRIKRRCRGSPIDEVIIPPLESINEVIDHSKNAIDDLSRFIFRHGGIPNFCTIYPMALGDWNQHRLNKGKTTILTKADEYHQMQTKLEEMICEVNGEIINTNRANKLQTPLIHKCLEHNRGKNKPVTYKYNLLQDGCHPSPKLAKIIAKSLNKTITLNKASIRYA